MAKKKSETEKISDKKDEILKEIADKLKEIDDKELSDEEKFEKSGLEEDVNLTENTFSQFIPSLHSPEDAKIPVLERVASDQPRPVFIGTLPQNSMEVPGEENSGRGDFEYVPSAKESDELKYLSSKEKRFSPEEIDFSRAGRRQEAIVPENQEAFFMRSEPSSQPESTSERMWAAERTDFERKGREDPFEIEKEKYKTYKPKLPKGY